MKPIQNPSLRSLPALAKENEGYLQKATELVLGASRIPDLLTDFLEVVATEGRVSINIGLEQLVEVLEARRYLNVFELGYSEFEIEVRYNKMGQYFPQLMAFIQEFPEVRMGKYGLLNLGNMGSTWPGFGGGRFCMVLKDPIVRAMDSLGELVCISKFSLAYFEQESFKLSESFFLDLSTYFLLPQLALLKHANEIQQMHRSWEKMLANSGRFIEIILLGEIVTSSFEEIRVKEGIWNELEDLEAQLEEGLSDVLVVEVFRWKKLKLESQRMGIPIVRMK